MCDYKDEEWLRKAYHDEGKSITETAQLCGACTPTVGIWLEKFEIPRRNRQQAARKKVEGVKHTDKAWLETLYLGQCLTIAQIAEQCGETIDTVLYWLAKHGIKRRGQGAQVRDKAYAKKEWLETEYTTKRKTMADIACQQGVTRSAISHWMKKHGIPTRRSLRRKERERSRARMRAKKTDS